MESLFVYGTLMLPEVQEAVIGRRVVGRPDRLAGFRRSTIRLGGNEYPIIHPAADGMVDGVVLEVTPAELRRIDAYETSAYRRTRVRLVSGMEAWVYRA